MVTKTERMTGADGKPCDVIYEEVPGEYTEAVFTPAVFVQAVRKDPTWKLVRIDPVVVAPPPPPPPPPNPTGPGLITEFTGVGDKSFKIDGVSASAQNANQPYNLQSPDNRTLRFELHNKDNWISSSAPGAWNDAANNRGAERNEIQLGGTFGPNATNRLGYEFSLEPGPANSAGWLLISQVHQTPAEGPPPFAIEMVKEKMRAMIRYKNGSDLVEKPFDMGTIVRGQKYRLRYEVKFGPDGNGVISVWMDDKLVVNYVGKAGYASQSYYWKTGLYRGPALETMVAIFRNISRA